MTTQRAIRVITVDDQAIVRSGLRALLDTVPDVDVVDEAENGQVAVDQAARHAPDIMIMDVQMPVVDGTQATRQVVTANPDIGVLMLTMFEDDANVFAAMRAGARGYLLKGATPTEIANAVRAVNDGQVVFGAALATRIANYFSTQPASAARAQDFAELTNREREILAHLAAGASNNSIARQLGISTKTVAHHVSNILMKTSDGRPHPSNHRARSAGLGN